jgi:hypothetical protein
MGLYDEVWHERHYKFDNYKALRGTDWTTYKTTKASDDNKLAALIDHIATCIVVTCFICFALYSFILLINKGF